MHHNEPKPGQQPAYQEYYPPRYTHDSSTSDDEVTHGRGLGGLKTWSKKVWIGVGVGVVLVIAIAIGVGVGVSEANKRNAYPNYAQVAYSLKETYEGSNFFDKFDYFTGYDPTGGFVHYVPAEQAAQLNLTYATDDTAILRVDTSVGPGDQPDASTGRFSVRVTSKNTYDEGLFLFDVKHSPYGCGTWPALWLTDPSNWPDNGEVDIMEAVNQADDGNQMTLHTSKGCSVGGVKRKQTGDSLSGTCNANKNNNAGCGVQGDSDSYGEGLNDNGGGVMAVEWRDAGIRMWQFARDGIPNDITSQSPDPSTWGTAAADFPSTKCDIGNHFRNQSIVVNINLCGELVYAQYDDSGCPSNCTDFVANNPGDFNNAFWEFGKFEVYQTS